MNEVFEDFVRTALREELALTAAQFPAGRTVALFLDEAGSISLQPDLSWWAGGKCRLVGDVKYKRVNVAGVKHPDLYQLLAYTTATDTAHGVLIYAAGEGEPAHHRIRRAGKHLHVIALDVTGRIETVHHEIRRLAGRLRELADQNEANSGLTVVA